MTKLTSPPPESLNFIGKEVFWYKQIYIIVDVTFTGITIVPRDLPLKIASHVTLSEVKFLNK